MVCQEYIRRSCVCLLHKAQIYQSLDIEVAIDALETGFDEFEGLWCLDSEGSVQLTEY
jgi:hypothetical protein